MQAIPYVLMAVGTAAQISAQNREAKEKRTILNRQMERDEQATKKAGDMVDQESQRFSQENRLQGLQDAENNTYTQTQADLKQGAGGATVDTASGAGNVSDDFLKTKASRAIEEGTRLTSIAREAAKARAPGQLRMNDSLSMADLSGRLQNLWGGTKNMGRATQMDAESVQAPGYGNLGKIASAVGGGMASSGFGVPAASTSGVPPNPYYRAGINFGAR